MGIVVIGATFVDIKGYPFNTFIPEGRNEGKILEIHGGVCRNIVEDIANLELRPIFISLVDQSGTSTEVIKKLKNHKVNTDYVRRTEDGLGTWLAVFDHHGDVVASISKRPDLLPICEILDAFGDEIFSNCDSIVFEIDAEKEIVKRIFSFAEKYNKKVYCAVSNMSIAVERRDFIKRTDCFVCNEQEAGILFSEDYSEYSAEQMRETLAKRIKGAGIRSMVVTMGGKGAVFADASGASGISPVIRVNVKDTTGAGDSFFAGVAAGLTYGKTLMEACQIGTRLAASVIATSDNVCPRFLPSEFGIDIKTE